VRGIVQDGLDPLLSLAVVSASGDCVEFSATVDTGFMGSLTLPPTAVRDLDLKVDRSSYAVLADGSIIRCEVYRAVVMWHDDKKPIDVYETDAPPLLGMELMQNCRLIMDVIPDGTFTILPLKSTQE
jgi:clan AA aspartic protease